MADSKIPLADTIRAVREELTQAVRAAQGQDIQFPVGEVTLEFQVGVTTTGEGGGGVKVWVIEAHVGASYAKESVQKVTVTLGAPVDRAGRPIKVSEVTSGPPQ